MKIDFSVLDKLHTAEDEHPDQEESFTRVPVASRLLAEQKERQQLRDTYNRLQENIKRSELLRTEILKGAKCGKTHSQLLIMAADCISLMTGQLDFSKQLQDDLKLLDAITDNNVPELLPDRKHRLHLIKRCVEQALEEY